ncbi:MAG: phenylalanine--tRNA ligase subunit alpha [Candidatus Marinimicrobia bacterium]|jgi:phenylalanyl-tRNA synthetase alpha chain|nr:phenylalanine--tRNA ligase subunit alpha [bacterium]MDP6569489.1 phenylalanine--tRNA ligase subunit alpha [Candidatus Neomarinimicrobiota bacterium]MDP6659842.1 phenylalanine--tRNA ligase subunit alpha [Candidatus Paceibacterota bacterium]|tara:strand:- start:34238 stop:34957 length:720 start_codon:yes stop_codon:yes gene_type:complete
MSKYHIHPLTSIIREVNNIFSGMGFTFAEGPEIETEYYNFDALNVPKDHPARDMQDTFFVDSKNEKVLRTHTSPVQIHYMENHEPPIRVIVPGKAYRNEATDMTHEAQFHQVEGLVVGDDITLAHMKGVLKQFFEKFFKGSVEIRLRPGFFPFVEPGAEVDMRLVGENVPEKLRGKWIEMLGSGMVHPNVLKSAGIDPDKYQGWAFGMGLERLGMLKYGIDDVRAFSDGDLRFIEQFSV